MFRYRDGGREEESSDGIRLVLGGGVSAFAWTRGYEDRVRDLARGTFLHDNSSVAR